MINCERLMNFKYIMLYIYLILQIYNITINVNFSHYRELDNETGEEIESGTNNDRNSQLSRFKINSLIQYIYL